MVESGEHLRHQREITPSLDTRQEGAKEGTFRGAECGRWESLCMELRAAVQHQMQLLKELPGGGGVPVPGSG